MDNSLLLHILIACHTLIGAINIACLFYLPYAAWKRRSPAKDRLLLVALVFPAANLILMAFNGMNCPMQGWASALTGHHDGWVRDVYWVPESWLRVVPWTFPIGYLVGAGLVFGHTLRGPARHAEVRAKQASKHAPGAPG
jgi:hypothetical protein